MSSTAYVCHIFSSSSTEKHRICFYAVTSVRLQISLRSYGMSLDICPEIGLFHLMSTLFLIFKGTYIPFLMIAIPVYIVTNSVQGFPFLHILDTTSNRLTFSYNSPFHRSEVIPHGLGLWSLWWEILETFSYSFWLFVCLLCKKRPVVVLCPFSEWVVSHHWVVWSHSFGY